MCELSHFTRVCELSHFTRVCELSHSAVQLKSTLPCASSIHFNHKEEENSMTQRGCGWRPAGVLESNLWGRQTQAWRRPAPSGALRTHPSPSLRHGGFPWEGTRRHGSTDGQDPRRLVLPPPGVRELLSPALQAPTSNHRCSCPGDGALHPLSPVGESLPGWPSLCPHSLRSTTLRASANRTAASLTSARLPCLSVCLRRPQSQGKELPKHTHPGSNPPGLATSAAFQLNHLDGQHVTLISTDRGNPV